MTKDLGRIKKLQNSVDTLSYITEAINRIQDETGIHWDDAPEEAINAAKDKIKELKKIK